MRKLAIGWLIVQGMLLLMALLFAPRDPDFRLLTSAALVLASFPLSLLGMYGAAYAWDALSAQGAMAWPLAAWVLCFAAGAAQLWIIAVLARRFRERGR